MLHLTLFIMAISAGTAFASFRPKSNLYRGDNKHMSRFGKPFFGDKEYTATSGPEEQPEEYQPYVDEPVKQPSYELKMNEPYLDDIPPPYSVPLSYAPVNYWSDGKSSTFEMRKDKFVLAADRTCKDQSGICKGPCKDDYVALNGICYKYIHLQLCFADAEQYCKQIAPKGHLASIHCRLNHMFIKNVIEVSFITSPYTWLGGSDCNKEGIFIWTDGTPMDHTAWCPSEPLNTNGKESCVALNHKSHFLWSTEDCSKQFNFVCAYKLACPTTDCSAC